MQFIETGHALAVGDRKHKGGVKDDSRVSGCGKDGSWKGKSGEKTRLRKNSVIFCGGNMLLYHPESIQPSSSNTITCIFFGEMDFFPSGACVLGNGLKYSRGRYQLVEAEQNN